MNSQRAAGRVGDELGISDDRNTDFEMWIKMATDNKINAKNSWNFELIDYFEDLSLLKEGKYINFQKASATLDGCVKIYTSRIDYAATETGKLLSGMATSRVKDNRKGGIELEENSSDDEDEVETAKQVTRRVNRKENTLVDSFEDIRLKKLESELSVDPIFKRTLSEFDEGGAKGLLLNTLSVDYEGRHVFDSAVGTHEKSISFSRHSEEERGESEKDESSVDLSVIAVLIGNEEKSIDHLTICPIMGILNTVLDTGSIPDGLMENNQPEIEFPDYPYDNEDGAEIFDDASYSRNEGILNDTLQRLFDEADIKERGTPDSEFENQNVADEDLLNYFDNNMYKSLIHHRKHWKLKNLLERNKQATSAPKHNQHRSSTKATVINFSDDKEVDDDELFANPVASTLIPKNRRLSSNKHLLPTNIEITAKRITTLFTKPVVLRTFRKRKGASQHDRENSDNAEIEWSKRYNKDEYLHEHNAPKRIDTFLEEDLRELHQSYDKSFFEDTSFENFIDPMEGYALERQDPIVLNNTEESSLNRFFRPTHINFARMARSVDIKQLKQHIWDRIVTEKQDSTDTNESHDRYNKGTSRNFRNVVKTVESKYQEETKNKPSMSLCFICLLHLANEHSLTLEKDQNNMDIIITESMEDSNQIA